ncbi:MAG: hypothetical protein MJ132_06680, partial [Clostridia bacterium]|nr:hypothetical protein [Clostridia bacterium]
MLKTEVWQKYGRSMTCICVCLAMLLSSLPFLSQTVSADSNSVKIENADFSQTAEDGALTGWTASAVSGAFGEWKQATSKTHPDEYASLSSSDGIWNMDTSLSSLIEVEPNTKYELNYSAELTGKSAGLSVWYIEYTKDGALTENDWRILPDCALSGNHGWSNYSSVLVTSEKAGYIALRFSVKTGTAGIDSVTLNKKKAFRAAPLNFEAVNLVPNGDFEEDFAYWSKSISGKATVTVTNEAVASGEKAVKMSLPSASDQGYLQGNQFAVDPSTKYLLTYQLKIVPKGAGNGAQCYALLYEFSGNSASGGLINSSGRWNTNNGEYETVSYEFTTKATTSTIRIDLMHNGVAGTSYWDNVSVVPVQDEKPVEKGDNLLANGGFEQDFAAWQKSLSGGATATIVADPVTEGKKAVKMVLPTASAQSYLQGNQFDVKPDTTYILSYKLKIDNVKDGNNAQCYAFLYTFNAQGTPSGGLLTSTGRWNTANGAYETVTYTFKTAADTKTARVDLMHNGVAGTSYWDDVTVKETEPSEDDDAILKNGTFTNGTENWSFSGNVSVQDEVAVSGKALKIENKNDNPCYAQSNFFQVEPNRVYIVSYDINVTEVMDETAGVNFSSFICAEGYWLDFATTGIYQKTDGFVEVKTAVTIPANVEFIAFGLRNYGGYGTAYIDNVKFTLTELDGTDPNLDFEADQDMILNWNFSTDNGSLSATDEVREGSDGTVAAKIVNKTAAGYATLKTMQLPVKPDHVYQFSYWVKMEGDYTAGTSMVFRQTKSDGSGASAIVSQANAPTSNVEKHQGVSEFVHATWTYRASADCEGWRNVVYSVKTASDAAFMEVHLSVTGGECIAIIDDVSLTEVTEDPNLDFENISDVTGAPENWHMSTLHQTGSDIGYDDTVYHSGKRSLHVKKTDDLEKVFIQSPVRFSVNKNYIYEFSAYVASKNASPDCTIRLDLIMYDEKGEQLYNDVYGNLTTISGEMLSLNGSAELGKWRKMMTRSVPDSRASYATLSFTVTHGSAEIWLDDIFFNVVDNGVDTVVDYNDFHAVDQNGNVAGWQVSGSGNLTTKRETTDNNVTTVGVFTSNSTSSYIKHKVDFHETEYTYCVKGDLTATASGVVQMRFYDYKGNEYTDKRAEVSINPAQKSFELTYVAPSCTTAELLIGGGAGTFKVDSVTFYQTGAPASKTQWQGKWVWYNEDPYQAQDNYRYFRYNFALEDGVKDAPFQITVDDKFALYVNGVEVINNWDAGGDSWSNVISLNLKKYLKNGANVLAIKAYNYVSEAGVLFDGKFTLNNNNTV